MTSARGFLAALARRIAATRRVWGRGEAHMALLDLTPEPVLHLPAGHIDTPASGSVVPRGVMGISGWAATAAGPCARVELTLDGQPLGFARLGLARPDVLDASGAPAAEFSGFRLVADLSERPGVGRAVRLGGSGIGLDGDVVSFPEVEVRLAQAPLDPPASPGSDEDERPRQPSDGLRAEHLRHRRPSGEGIRLLVCSHQLHHGGAELFLVELVRQLGARVRITGTVMAFADGLVREEFERLGFEVHLSPFPSISSPAEYESRLAEIVAWIGSSGYDVALVNSLVSFPAADACARLGLPCVWAIHESYPLPTAWSDDGARDELWNPGPGFDPLVKARAERALSESVLAFVSDATRACYEPYLSGARCVTLRYGVDVDALEMWRAGHDRAADRRKRGIAQDAFVILCVGTICPRKGQVPLIQAFSRIADRHPRALLALVGGQDPTRPDAARTAAAAYGVQERVRVVPMTPDVLPWYADADLLVSASDVESLPRSMLEAMALGLPVLGTSIFGVRDLIANRETGWLCEARDVGALAAALDRVLALPPAERVRVADAAQAMVRERYRSDSCSFGWAELLAEVVRAHAPAA